LEKIGKYLQDYEYFDVIFSLETLFYQYNSNL